MSAGIVTLISILSDSRLLVWSFEPNLHGEINWTAKS